MKKFSLPGTLLIGSLLGLGVSFAPARSVPPILPESGNCVAYKTHKTLAMVASQDVVGTNCNVSVKAAKASNGNLSAEIRVPISAFNSQEHDRDEAVAKLLKANVKPDIVIRTMALSPAQWQQMLHNGAGTVKAELQLGGRAYPISTTAHFKRNGNQVTASGVIVTQFTAFGIQPPEVGPGGLIAKAPDYLELHYNLLSSHLQNMGVVPIN